MKYDIRHTHRQPKKNIIIKGWRLFILVCLSGGCENTPPPAPPPLIIMEERTVNLQPVNRELVDLIGKGKIRNYQYYISSPIVLLGVFSQPPLPKGNNVGSLDLTKNINRKMINIDGKTKGVAIDCYNPNGKQVLRVSFEQDDDEVFLEFMESGDDGFFNLYAPNKTVTYGKEAYHVFKAEETIRLLVNIEARINVQNEERYVFGRTIDTVNVFEDTQRQEPAGASRTPGTVNPQREEDIRLYKVLKGYLTQVEDGNVYATSQELDDLRQSITRIKERNNLP